VRAAAVRVVFHRPVVASVLIAAVAHESRQPREGLPVNIAPREYLAAHRHAVPRPRIRQREIIIMMVRKRGGRSRVEYALVAAVVSLIDHGTHPLLQIAAERR